MAETTRPALPSALKAWPWSRKLSLVAVVLTCAAVFAVIIMQAQVADMRLLFANLESSDASAVVTWLKERKIPYKLENDGRAIHVPADKVYETRLDLAGAGLPQGGGVGFEVFDKQSFGLTDFAQKINYLRALQGELSRTITSLAPVEAARVHLALPEKRLFKDQQQASTASVILKIAPGRELKDPQIQGIIRLVAGSIEGLDADNVTVVDSTGKMLSRAPSSDTAGPTTPGMLDYQQAMERRMENRAQSLLDAALGPGNSQVKVTAALDFMQQESTEEIFDPEKAVPRSEQSSTEKGAGTVVGGVPGAQTNLQGTGGQSATTPSSRSEETVNYEISKTVSRKVYPVGSIQKLSVAVLVADRMTPGTDGQPATYVPRNDKELSAINTMVSRALGIDGERGDLIEVSSMPFENIFSIEENFGPSPVNTYYDYLPFLKYGLLALGAALLYFLLARPVLKTLSGPRVVNQMKTVEELEMELSGQKALPQGPVDPAEHLRRHALEQQGPFAKIIKTWLREG